MSRVGLIIESLICRFEARIKNAYLIGPSAALPNASTDLELEMLSELLFIVIQIGICTKSRKVVASNDDTDITSLVIAAAWIIRACHNTNGLESAPVSGLPDVTCVTAAVCASNQSTNEVGCEASFLLADA